MGFLRRLFGGQNDAQKQHSAEMLTYVEGTGIFIHPECGTCKRRMRLRIDKERDLENDGAGYTWHKTLVCNNNRCFRRMPTVVHFDSKFNVATYELEKGRYLTLGEFDRLEAEDKVAKAAAERAATEEALAEEQDSAENDSDNSSGGGKRGFD